MISAKYLLILLSIFSVFIIAPNSSDAEVYPEQYDFGAIEMGSTQTTLVSITNISLSEVPLRVAFYGDTCGVFSIVTSPVPATIPEGNTVEIQIGFSPSNSEQCSAEFHIFTDGSPVPSRTVTFTGTGFEAKNDELVNGEQRVDLNCPCDISWKNHDEYVSCVVHAAEEYLITKEEKGAIVSARAKSDCGKKK